MGNNLEYKIGETTNVTILNENETIKEMTYDYSVYDDTTGLFNTHRFGYFLAVASAIGFIGTLVSIKGGWKK